MILFRINSTGFNTAMARLINQASDRRPLMHKIGGIMHDEVEQNFANEADRGNPWPHLAPSTIRARVRKKKWPGKIGHVSGQLVGSIQIQSDNDEAIVGTAKEYAPAFHFGYKPRNQPPRPFLTLSERAIEEIANEVRLYTLRGFV